MQNTTVTTTVQEVSAWIGGRIGLDPDQYKIYFSQAENCIVIKYAFWQPFFGTDRPNWLAGELANVGFNAVAITRETTHIY